MKRYSESWSSEHGTTKERRKKRKTKWKEEKEENASISSSSSKNLPTQVMSFILQQACETGKDLLDTMSQHEILSSRTTEGWNGKNNILQTYNFILRMHYISVSCNGPLWSCYPFAASTDYLSLLQNLD